MREDGLKRDFVRYAAYNVCGMIGLSCYVLADTFFISLRLGVKGLTALNLAIPVYDLVHGCGLMFGMGGAAKYAVYREQGETERADQCFSRSLCAMAGVAVFFVAAGLFLSGRLTALLGADDEVFRMTKTYLRVILVCSPAFMANDVLLCFVRNDGNPGLSMAAMLTGSISNIVLDYVFLFPLAMGMLGAVSATALAPVISICVLSRHRVTKRNQFHFVRGRSSPGMTGKIISLGLPSLVTEAASGIVMLFFNFLVLNAQGNIGVAAYGVIANLSLVVASVHTGIAQGMQPILSRVCGQGDRKGMGRLLRYAVTTTLILSGCIYVFLLASADAVVGAFNREQSAKLQEIAVTGLKLYFLAAPFAGFNVVASAYFMSTERALPAQAVSTSRGFIVILPMAFLMSRLLKMEGIWLSYPMTECLVAMMAMLLCKRASAKGK